MFVWGSRYPDDNPESTDVHRLYPVAMETNIGTVLSNDSDDADGEARISMPIRRVARGDDDTTIRSVLAIITTAGPPGWVPGPQAR